MCLGGGARLETCALMIFLMYETAARRGVSGLKQIF